MPPWNALNDLIASAEFFEKTNKLTHEWAAELEESHKELRET